MILPWFSRWMTFCISDMLLETKSKDNKASSAFAKSLKAPTAELKSQRRDLKNMTKVSKELEEIVRAAKLELTMLDKKKQIVIWVNPENEEQKRQIKVAAAMAGLGMGPFLLKLGLEAYQDIEKAKRRKQD